MLFIRRKKISWTFLIKLIKFYFSTPPCVLFSKFWLPLLYREQKIYIFLKILLISTYKRRDQNSFRLWSEINQLPNALESTPPLLLFLDFPTLGVVYDEWIQDAVIQFQFCLDFFIFIFGKIIGAASVSIRRPMLKHSKKYQLLVLI